MGRKLGCVLLVAGTSIGGGMLALPIVTAQAGLLPATLLMFFIWVFMTLGAFWLLEVNLAMPAGANLISMASKTLGWPGKLVAWLSYLCLLYCLLAVYISGGADVIQRLCALENIHASTLFCALVFLAIFSTIVWHGVRSVDWVNRFLITLKFVTLIILVVFAMSHVHWHHFAYSAPHLLTVAVMPVITSFGYAIIIPSLRAYLNNDVVQMRKVLIIGSLIPLVCYILWVTAILGALPRSGPEGLVAMMHSGHSVSDLMVAIGHIVTSHLVLLISKTFTTICVGTSFLGVSLAMCHFLKDGLGTKDNWQGSLLVYIATYALPLAMVLYYPNAFIMGLRYAGSCCVVLLLLLPALMVWSQRSSKTTQATYRVWGGRSLLVLGVVVSILAITIDFLS